MDADDIVLVTWRDAWFDLDNNLDHEDYMCQTVGWVIAIDTHFLHVAQEKTPDGWRAVTHIPIVGVESQTTLPEEVVPAPNPFSAA